MRMRLTKGTLAALRVIRTERFLKVLFIADFLVRRSGLVGVSFGTWYKWFGIRRQRKVLSGAS
jgi:hypothetical protein